MHIYDNFTFIDFLRTVIACWNTGSNIHQRQKYSNSRSYRSNTILECHANGDKRHVDISDWILLQSKLWWSGHVLLLEFYSRVLLDEPVKPIKELDKIVTH